MEYQFIFTRKDHRLLRALLRSDVSLIAPQRALLQWKLDRCLVVEQADIPGWVATSGSRVRYRLDGGDPLTDRLTARTEWSGAGAGLPLTTGRGIALVGLGEGYEMPFVDRGGQEHVVTLDTVCFQPEAARATWLGTPPRSKTPNVSSCGSRP